MINSLPQDVNEIIYEYILFSINHNKFFCISKSVTKNINNSQIIKKEKLFYEMMNMLKEDEYKYTKDIRLNNTLYKTWNRYNLYKWYEHSHYKHAWNKGDYIDAYDYVRGWCPALIIDTSIERKTTLVNNQFSVDFIRYYDVRFLGWSDDFIEKVPFDKLAPLGRYTINPFNVFESITRDISYNSYYWTLCKKNNEWDMCKIIDNIIDNDCIKLLADNGNLYKIYKNKTNENIRHITDVTSFLSLNKNLSFLKDRHFKF